MTLRQVMESMSQLEMIAWLQKYDEDRLKPSLTDWYLMQIAREIDHLRHFTAKLSFTKALKSYMLKYDTPKPATSLTPVEKVKAIDRVKSIWATRLNQKTPE